jgi:hypothetical protein
MKQWKAEANIKGVVLYNVKEHCNDNNETEYTLYICTNSPGAFIGPMGDRVADYEHRIRLLLGKPVKVHFIETVELI